MMNIKDNFMWSLATFWTTLQFSNCELQDVMKNMMTRNQEWKEIISEQDGIITNLSKIIEDQKEIISASNETRLLLEHASKLDQMQGNITGKTQRLNESTSQ